MAHKIAKLLLEQADTFLQRKEAIKSAMRLGMPLRDIEDYLDWLGSVKSGGTNGLDRGGDRASCEVSDRQSRADDNAEVTPPDERQVGARGLGSKESEHVERPPSYEEPRR